MPDFNTKISINSFQQCDGTNFSTVGSETTAKLKKGNIGTYTGVGLTFDGKPMSAIFDIKGSTNYGNSNISGGFRVRHNLNENAQSVQLRVQPCTVKVPVNEKTSIYTTPYVATKISYNNGKAKTTVGAFGGISTKVGKASVFVEGQIYDATKINKNTTSVNVGVSIPI